MGLCGFFPHLLHRVVIEYYMIRTDKTCKIECLARGARRYRPHFRVIGNGRRRNKFVARHYYVAPYLVRENGDIVLFVYFHSALYLFFFPNPSRGIVRRAEYGKADIVFDYFLFHV